MIYALGWYTPLFKPMHAFLPGVDLYRRPADAVFVIGFFGSVLAGFVLNEILSAPCAALTALANCCAVGNSCWRHSRP